MLRGGALLGSGTYGCIFEPPLICKDEPKKHKDDDLLGKITSPDDYIIEMTAAKILGPLKLPYFILPDEGSGCIPDMKQLDKDVAKCDLIKKKGTERLDSVIQFTMRYGGKTLYKRIVDYDFLKGKLNYFDLFLQLLEAGSYLLSSNYIHFDISTNNVVVDENGQVALIDFGQSFSSKLISAHTLDLRRKRYDPRYTTEPPEITLSQAPDQKIDNVSDVVTKKGIFHTAQVVLGLQEVEQAAELRDFWYSSHAVQDQAKDQDWIPFWKLYWPTYDSWGIGGCLLDALVPLLYKKEFVDSQLWIRRGPIIKSILRGMLQANPRKRLDCIEALKLYDPGNAWFDVHGTSWIEAREKQRSS